VPVQPEALDPAFAGLERDVAAGHASIAALAVGDSRGTVRKQVYSTAGVRSYPPESIFFLASVTKPIFATAFMQLVEEGLVELHAPLAGHLPEFRGGQRERVTAWHLLTHTSGLEDVSVEVIQRTRPSNAQLTELSLHAAIRFEPGTRYEYTSSSYFVMAELARRVTGEPPRAFLQRRVLDPLGMAETGYDPRGRGRPIVPVTGVGAESRIRRYLLLRYVASMAHPGGGLFGTLDDLARFGAAWLAPRHGASGRWLPLAPETVALMAQDHTRGLVGAIDGEEVRVHHGLAWNKPTLMKDVPGGPDVIDHGGASGTRLWIDPGAGLVFVYFSAQWNPNRDIERRTLWSVYRALGLA
jgi:CubicO group peptidase (beta-lactamase class C family)